MSEELEIEGRSPGLVVMGGDSDSEGCGFESRRRVLDGHYIFSHLFVEKPSNLLNPSKGREDLSVKIKQNITTSHRKKE